MVSQHALQVVSQHALQQVSWGRVASQHALQVVNHHTLQQVSRGCPGPHPGGSSGVWSGGSPGPCLAAGLQGGPQAHTRGWVEGLAKGVSRPTSGGGGLSPGPHPVGCIPACTEADTSPPPSMATAAGGTHQTGMHSSSLYVCKCNFLIKTGLAL